MLAAQVKSTSSANGADSRDVDAKDHVGIDTLLAASPAIPGLTDESAAGRQRVPQQVCGSHQQLADGRPLNPKTIIRPIITRDAVR